jgi:hypothetical protein
MVEGDWCWWCCHSFEGIPLHLPHKYDDKRKKFETMGNFCSWECMKSFNMDRNKNLFGIIAGNIVLMYKSMYGNVRSINCAPSRFSLKTFGGKLTIEEFRSVSKATNKGAIVKMPDELHRLHEVIIRNEVKGIPISREQDKIDEITHSTTTVHESLKLKRQKPLKRDENNLEKSLGIIRRK